MAYYYTCPYCGCNLDPGEDCDCEGVQRIKDMRIKQAETYRRAEQEKKNER